MGNASVPSRTHTAPRPAPSPAFPDYPAGNRLVRHFFLFLCAVTQVMPNPLRPHGLQPAMLFRPWNFPSRNAGMGFYFLLRGIFSTRDRTCVSCVSCTGKCILYRCTTWEVPPYFSGFQSNPWKRHQLSCICILHSVHSAHPYLLIDWHPGTDLSCFLLIRREFSYLLIRVSISFPKPASCRSSLRAWELRSPFTLVLPGAREHLLSQTKCLRKSQQSQPTHAPNQLTQKSQMRARKRWGRQHLQ